MLKKLFLTALTLVIAFAFCGCKASDKENFTSDSERVIVYGGEVTKTQDADGESVIKSPKKIIPGDEVVVEKPNTDTVYCTKNGIRYHYDADCAGDNATETTVEEAKRQGLTPCKICSGG